MRCWPAVAASNDLQARLGAALMQLDPRFVPLAAGVGPVLYQPTFRVPYHAYARDNDKAASVDYRGFLFWRLQAM